MQIALLAIGTHDPGAKRLRILSSAVAMPMIP
jgi:hypothetical protein